MHDARYHGCPARGICLPVTPMRLGRHILIPIPRNLHSASQRLPRPFLPAYNRLYNSSLASTTPSVDVDSNVVTQRLSSQSSQLTPMHEYSKLVEADKIRSDDYQTEIIRKLQALHDALALYDTSQSAGPPSLVRISPFPFRHILSYPHSRV